MANFAEYLPIVKKIPTIAIVYGLFHYGVKLLLSPNPSMTVTVIGIILVVLGVILGLYSYIDYKKMEGADVWKQYMETTLQLMQSALKSITDTASTRENDIVTMTRPQSIPSYQNVNTKDKTEGTESVPSE